MCVAKNDEVVGKNWNVKKNSLLNLKIFLLQLMKIAVFQMNYEWVKMIIMLLWLNWNWVLNQDCFVSTFKYEFIQSLFYFVVKLFPS